MSKEIKDPGWKTVSPLFEKPRTMLEVGVEGDRFNPHPENSNCVTMGCVPEAPVIVLTEDLNKDKTDKRFLCESIQVFISGRRPDIFELARKRCESRLMANPPCQSCLIDTVFDWLNGERAATGTAKELAEIKAAIREILSQKFDDLCWQDIYTQLGKFVGMEFKPELLPRETFLANCDRFITSLHSGLEYQRPLDPDLALRALLATIRGEYGSVSTWALHAHDFPGIPKDELPAIISALEQLSEEDGRLL